jgi:DNA-binding NtrC family response regulator
MAGLIASADGGTIFLDEICALGALHQRPLLNFLRTREIRLPGWPRPRHVEVRVIAATCRDLRQEARQGRLTTELLEYFAAVQIRIPNLAERQEDIPLLTKYFLAKYRQTYGKNILGLTRRAQIVLSRHEWSENIRELENAISSAVVAASRDFIDIHDLPERFQSTQRWQKSAESDSSLDAARLKHIRRVFRLCGGNHTQAAHMLGISPSTLHRHLRASKHSEMQA